MSNIIPLKIEYNFQLRNHRLRASAEHLESGRRITFFFDDKIVSERMIPAGDFFTDDDRISELVSNYCKNQTGVYADLFTNHADQVHLLSKTLDFTIENCGIVMSAHVIVENGRYLIEVSGNNGEDAFSGSFKSKDFSEVLEKIRLFTSTLVDISNSFSSHINELSDDKVEAWIKW